MEWDGSGSRISNQLLLIVRRNVGHSRAGNASATSLQSFRRCTVLQQYHCILEENMEASRKMVRPFRSHLGFCLLVSDLVVVVFGVGLGVVAVVV